MKKLTLSKETIRRLDENNLQEIRGGKTPERADDYTVWTDFKCFLETDPYTRTADCPCWD